MTKKLFNNLKNACLTLLLFHSMIGFSQVVIRSQGFESSSADNLTYTVSSTNNVGISGSAAMSGNNSLRMGGSSNVLFQNVDLAHYTNVRVSVAFAAVGVDDNEDLFIEFSYNNGSTYTTTIQLVDGNSGGSGQDLAFGTGDASPGQINNPYIFSVPNNRNSVRVRIRATNLDSNEFYYIDDLRITGMVDTDGDGIDDTVDLDDDNDGILDSVECGSCVIDAFENGDFESPVIANSSYAILPSGNVPGWNASAENFIEIWSSGFNGVPAASGNQFAELNANVAGILYQSFCLNGAGGTISWSIKHRGRSGVDQAFVKFGPTLAASLASTPIATMVDGNTAWGTYSGTYIIPEGLTQIVLTFQAGYTASGSQSIGNFIDDVEISINHYCIDTDKDGIADYLDLDSDNDGIPDIEEANFHNRSNKKSTFDLADPLQWKDDNANGVNDYIEATVFASNYAVPDTDGDLIPDYIDLDSDNDSHFDVDEAGLLNGDGDINGDGKGDGADSDGDGILDLYDNSNNFGTINRNYAQDSDNNGIPDYRQLDSNSDGVFDIQNGLYAALDTNNNGKINGSADIDRDGIIDTFDTNTSFFGSPRNLNRKLFLEFDGRNDYAQDAQILSGLPQATMMAWVNLTSPFNTTGAILGQGNFLMRVTSSRRLQVVVNGNSTQYSPQLSHSLWYHLAATVDGNHLRIYVNGTNVMTVAASGNLNNDTSLFTLGKNPTANNHYFKGKIDEVRVFNTALTEDQIRQMVNQEIEKNNNHIRGTVIPRNIDSLPFSSLIRYYRMDTYKDDIVDNLVTPTVDSGTGMKLFNHKNIKPQQAPMPFETERAGNFATAVSSTVNEVSGSDITANSSSIVRVNHNITETSNVTTVGLIVSPNVTISMENDTKIQNDWYLKLDGKIDLKDRSQLIQTVDSELAPNSIGSIERDQKGQSNKFNYNYWSSPVSTINNSTINHGYTVSGVMKDGSNPANPMNFNWVSGVNNPLTSNPITLSSYWIFKFQNVSPIYANWSAVGQNGLLLAGQGYTLKGSGSATADQNFTFVGKPNNGEITSSVSANNLNLSGNPYPSALDANEFISQNLGSINGTLYFWEHFPTNNTHNLAGYQGGYATRTLVGGTAPVSPTEISGLGSSSRVPGRFIPVGQGFFVTGNATGGTIVFNNSQRLFVKENNASSNILFRSSENQANSEEEITNAEDEFSEDEFMKVRIGFNSYNNFHRQLLIGFMDELATEGIDPGYDAIHIDNQQNDMYFLNDGQKLMIQGASYFDSSKTYPLGVKTFAAGTVEFTLDGTENVDESIDIFIHDKTTGIYHSIRNEHFTVDLPQGEIHNRFELTFGNETLSTGDFDIDTDIKVAFTNANNTLTIKNNLTDVTVQTVSIFTILGQTLATWNVENLPQTNISLPVSNASIGTYIVRVQTTHGTISKKIIIK